MFAKLAISTTNGRASAVEVIGLVTVLGSSAVTAKCDALGQALLALLLLGIVLAYYQLHALRGIIDESGGAVSGGTPLPRATEQGKARFALWLPLMGLSLARIVVWYMHR